ncbi:hypothetical protein ACMFMF_006972 [Clarireedia jacksonii]
MYLGCDFYFWSGSSTTNTLISSEGTSSNSFRLTSTKSDNSASGDNSISADGFNFENGDVDAKVLIKELEIKFKALPHTLSFASQVWKDFLSLCFLQAGVMCERRANVTLKETEKWSY